MNRFKPLVVAVALLGTAWAATPVGAGPSSTARAAMRRTLPEMKFEGIALGDCIDFLRDVTNANIFVNWKALESAGVTRETPINVRLRSVSLAKVLSLVLSEAGGGSDLLTYELDEGVIEITTRELADLKMYTRVYPVEDLLMEIPDFEGRSMSLSDSNSQQGSGSGGGGGGGLGLFGGGGGGNDDEDRDKGKTRQERADDLVGLIQETIKPDIWRDAGGPASIRFWNGNLIVTAPRSVHEALGGPFD